MISRTSTLFAGCLSALMGFGGLTSAAHAQDRPLQEALNDRLDIPQLRFEGSETVDTPERFRYLVLDFRLDVPEQEVNLQASIHQICSRILLDENMLKQLTGAGYDMVSVAFDDISQYDCL